MLKRLRRDFAGNLLAIKILLEELMRGYLQALCAVMLLSIVAFGCNIRDRMPEETQPNTWSRAEMSSRRGFFLEADLKPNSPLCGFGLVTCSFELYYFKGPRGYDKSRSLHILYIPGGPGDVVDRENPPLDIFNIAANFAYFDVRGTGYSSIHESNNYDQFLRAKYVVEDIEALRKKYFNECSKGEKPVETGCREGRYPWECCHPCSSDLIPYESGEHQIINDNEA